MDRHLDWDGCFNVRDLGNLRVEGGGTTRWRAVVRADCVDRLTPAGWSALRAHGVRTVIDLRNDEERTAGAAAREGVTTVHVPLDDSADIEFWRYCRDNQLDGSPLYYRPFLESKSKQCAAVIAAIAQAGPGGVVVHCAIGRDRTGLIALILLALAGVVPDDIVSDYELSAERLRPWFSLSGRKDHGPVIQEILRRKGTCARSEILGLLQAFDFGSYLRSGGLSEEDLTAVRTRLAGVPHS